MSSRNSKDETEIKIPRPTSRLAKIALIRETFADQGKIIAGEKTKISSWDGAEQNRYFVSIGLDPTRKGVPRTDEELDKIIADLEKNRMILFKN